MSYGKELLNLLRELLNHILYMARPASLQASKDTLLQSIELILLLVKVRLVVVYYYPNLDYKQV